MCPFSKIAKNVNHSTLLYVRTPCLKYKRMFTISKFGPDLPGMSSLQYPKVAVCGKIAEDQLKSVTSFSRHESAMVP